MEILFKCDCRAQFWAEGGVVRGAITCCPFHQAKGNLGLADKTIKSVYAVNALPPRITPAAPADA